MKIPSMKFQLVQNPFIENPTGSNSVDENPLNEIPIGNLHLIYSIQEVLMVFSNILHENYQPLHSCIIYST